MTEEKDKEEDEDEDEKSKGHTDHQAVQLDCVSVFMSSRCRSRWKVRAEVSLFVRWGSGQAWSGIYTDSKPGQINTAAGVGGEATPSREKGGRRHGDRQPIPAHHRAEGSSAAPEEEESRRREYRKRVGNRATLSRDPGRGFLGEWRGSCSCSASVRAELLVVGCWQAHAGRDDAGLKVVGDSDVGRRERDQSNVPHIISRTPRRRRTPIHLFIHSPDMSCSETFTSADGPLRITNLDLHEHLSGLVGGVHTPTHRKKCQEWAKSICDHINHRYARTERAANRSLKGVPSTYDSCGVNLKVVGMEFSRETKGYVLLEGPAPDKNYALLRRPDIGRKLVALLYFPDHW